MVARHAGFFLFLFLVLQFVHSTECHAGPIYVYKEDDGVIRFSNKPPKDGREAQVFTAKSSKFSIYSGIRRPKRQGKLFLTAFTTSVNAAARKYRIHPALIRAVIHVESAFNPSAVSPKGAQGLMQLMPSTAKLVGVRDPFSVPHNIDGGTQWLRKMLQRFRGNVKLALAAYNAGPGSVEKYGGVPPFKETQNYVADVLRLRQSYANGLKQLALKEH
ncbi:MAG: lytic transglycosylase domain-containing protein [Bdellovibrionales bacterium]|nr:lytic transglycosylase domain-containing protein [Bdellovibrionales bacterium]